MPATLSKVPAGVIAPVKQKAAAIIKATGSRVTHVWGYNTTPDHNNRRCVDFMVRSIADGTAVAAFIWANRVALGVRLIIWNRRIIRTYPKPGIPAGTWAAYTGESPHRDHPHVEFNDAPLRPLTGTTPAKPGKPSKPAKKTRYRVTASSGLWGLNRPGGPTSKRLYLRTKGYIVVAVKTVTGPDGRRWAVTRAGTHYSMNYLRKV